MTILREVNRTGDLHSDAGVEAGSFRSTENFSRHTELSGALRVFDYYSKRLRSLEKHQQSALHPAELVSRYFSYGFETSATRKVEVAQQGALRFTCSGVAACQNLRAHAKSSASNRGFM